MSAWFCPKVNVWSVFQWLAEMYNSQGLLTEASVACKQSLQLASQFGDNSGKISSLLRLALLALRPCMVRINLIH